MGFTMEKHIRIYNTDQGVFFAVRPSPECPGFLLMETQDKESNDWYGKMYFNFSNEEAKLLAAALIEIVGE